MVTAIVPVPYFETLAFNALVTLSVPPVDPVMGLILPSPMVVDGITPSVPL